MGKKNKKTPIVEYKINRKGSTPIVDQPRPVRIRDDKVERMIAELRQTVEVVEIALSRVKEKVLTFRLFRPE